MNWLKFRVPVPVARINVANSVQRRTLCVFKPVRPLTRNRATVSFHVENTHKKEVMIFLLKIVKIIRCRIHIFLNISS
jgi:hypothetical protein